MRQSRASSWILHIGLVWTVVGLAVPALGGAGLQTSAPGLSISSEGEGKWRVTSPVDEEFTLEWAASLPARAGDCFQIDVRVRVDLKTRAVPELACYDASGREIPAGTSLLKSSPLFVTTDWQRFSRAFPARPGTSHVRARLRASGRGELHVADLELRPVRVDPYQTGALITQLSPQRRSGLILESNLAIENTELVSREDLDGDRKWAEILVDLDGLSSQPGEGEDWRTRFAYNPNADYWSDGAVLKSDTVREDRSPDPERALHFRMKIHPGPYRAILSDPGRAIAVSLDGKQWRRFEGGSEAELGTIESTDGVVEFWVDACYRDPISCGPVYFDYVRLVPIDHASSAERLCELARRRPAPVAGGWVERREVAVSVSMPRWTGTEKWPVRCGLPIPAGELASPEKAGVLDREGHPLATQNRSLGTWPDGSIKWLYLDFMHDASRNGEGRYTVVYGEKVRAVAPSTAVRTRTTPEGIEVDTGAIHFLVPRSHFGILQNVRLGSGEVLQEAPIAIDITETQGRTWRTESLPVERLEIEQSGPLHAVILAASRLAEPGSASEGFYHAVRLHAYAGSALVQLDYFVANTDQRPELTVRSIRMSLRPARAAAGEGRIVQADSREAGGQGWVSLPGEAGIAIGVEAFREQYPKALRWMPREVQLDLWAPEGGDYTWYQGVGKTHRISLVYQRDLPEDASALAAGPVLALAEPAWYAASGAFGPIEPANAGPLPEVERTLAEHMDGPVIAEVGLGFENYGDHHSPGYVRESVLWDNNEYDLPAAAMIHFVRTGNPAALRIALASALHYVDVDVVHYSREHPDWVGAAHTHSHGTFGHHTAEPPSMSHAGYVQGLIWYTCLTGDRAGVDGAKGIAEWVLRRMAPEVSVGRMERTIGHPLTTLNDVYEATWDEKYLKGAARLVDWVLKWEQPGRGGFPAIITERPAFYAGSPFCSGLLSSALMKFNGWARTSELDRLLERTGRYLLTDMWRPPADIVFKGGMSAGPMAITSHLRLMPDLYERTGDPLFLAVPLASLEASLGGGDRSFGTRTTGLVYNYVPWFLAKLRQVGGSGVEPSFELAVEDQSIDIGRGGRASARVTVRNSGPTPISELKVTFQPRLDFAVLGRSETPAELEAGGSTDITFEVQAPARINLTASSTRNAYAHWSASYRRAGRLHLAHAWTKLVIHE